MAYNTGYLPDAPYLGDDASSSANTNDQTAPLAAPAGFQQPPDQENEQNLTTITSGGAGTASVCSPGQTLDPVEERLTRALFEHNISGATVPLESPYQNLDPRLVPEGHQLQTSSGTISALSPYQALDSRMRPGNLQMVAAAALLASDSQHQTREPTSLAELSHHNSSGTTAPGPSQHVPSTTGVTAVVLEVMEAVADSSSREDTEYFLSALAKKARELRSRPKPRQQGSAAAPLEGSTSISFDLSRTELYLWSQIPTSPSTMPSLTSGGSNENQDQEWTCPDIPTFMNLNVVSQEDLAKLLTKIYLALKASPKGQKAAVKAAKFFYSNFLSAHAEARLLRTCVQYRPSNSDLTHYSTCPDKAPEMLKALVAWQSRAYSTAVEVPSQIRRNAAISCFLRGRGAAEDKIRNNEPAGSDLTRYLKEYYSESKLTRTPGLKGFLWEHINKENPSTEDSRLPKRSLHAVAFGDALGTDGFMALMSPASFASGFESYLNKDCSPVVARVIREQCPTLLDAYQSLMEKVVVPIAKNEPIRAQLAVAKTVGEVAWAGGCMDLDSEQPDVVRGRVFQPTDTSVEEDQEDQGGDQEGETEGERAPKRRRLR